MEQTAQQEIQKDQTNELTDAEKIVQILDSYRMETGTHLTIQELVDGHNWELLQVDNKVIGVVSISVLSSIKRGKAAYIDLLYVLRPYRPDDIMSKVWIDIFSLLQNKGYTRYEVHLPQSLSIQFKRLTNTFPKEYRYWGRAPFVIRNLKDWQEANITGGE